MKLKIMNVIAGERSTEMDLRDIDLHMYELSWDIIEQMQCNAMEIMLTHW